MDIFESKKNGKSSGLTKLRQQMRRGVVKFKYIKKDGKERTAFGTLKDTLIPEIDRDDDRKKKLSKDCFYYYDLGKEDWRCFLRDNFIDIV